MVSVTKGTTDESEARLYCVARRHYVNKHPHSWTGQYIPGEEMRLLKKKKESERDEEKGK